MRRPVFAWLIFGVGLIAATLAVGWLTRSAWRSDLARQDALLDSEIRNALWRMDSLVAPLLAVEVTRPTFAEPVANAPILARKLVKGYVVRDARGRWTIRENGLTDEKRPLFGDCPLVSVDWTKKLDATQQFWPLPSKQDGINTLSTQDLESLITWPKPAPNQPPPLQQVQIAQNVFPSPEAQNRNQLVQQLSQIAIKNQQQGAPQPSRSANATAISPEFTPLQAVWVGSELVFARRTVSSKLGGPIVELCWMNWPEWQALLNAQLGEMSTRVRLIPCASGLSPAPNRWQMVSLPIRLEPIPDNAPTPWPLPLLVVWGLLLAVAIAFGWLMWQTLSLSERRAAFVSAVTHELRTPLTTFRLYTEMLSEGLATDVEQQQTYYRTLHREANRLTHLVENVLAYARLENGRTTARHEQLTAGDLIERCRPRLEQRVAETRLELSFEFADAARSVRLTTNAMAVEQVLFNLIDNCCKYARDATDPRILCSIEVQANHMSIQVRDFGPGLSPQARRTLFQPFQKSSSQAAESAPGVGLGLALSHRLARDLNGSLRCQPNQPCGLCFEFRLPWGG